MQGEASGAGEAGGTSRLHVAAGRQRGWGEGGEEVVVMGKEKKGKKEKGKKR